MTYPEKLKDPRWQKKRLEILERDKWKCACCFADNRTLHVHHKKYCDGNPWDAPKKNLTTLCEDCHDAIHKESLHVDIGVFRAVKYLMHCAIKSGDTRPAIIQRCDAFWKELGAKNV